MTGGLHVALREAQKGRRPIGDDQTKMTSLRDLQDKLEKEKERNEELARQLREERKKVDEKIPQQSKFFFLFFL